MSTLENSFHNQSAARVGRDSFLVAKFSDPFHFGALFKEPFHICTSLFDQD